MSSLLAQKHHVFTQSGPTTDIAKRSIAAQTCSSIGGWQAAKGRFSGAGGLSSELQGIKWRNGNVGPLEVRTQPPQSRRI